MSDAQGVTPPDLGWPELIGFMGKLKMELAQVQPVAYPMRPPRVAAGEHDLLEAERRLGHRLDPQYRAFLQHANGWPSFFVDVSLLGADELGQGELWEKGQETLDIFYQEALPPPGFPKRADLVPLAVAVHSVDVHVLWRSGAGTGVASGILWLAGEEVDRWPTFDEYFRSMYSYLERGLAVARAS